MAVRLLASSQQASFQTSVPGNSEALPKEIMIQIFSYLKLQTLASCCRVSRRWQEWANDPTLWKVAICREIAFGKERWAIYFGDVGTEPSLPDNIREILQSPCPFWPDKRVEETHLLVLVPTTVNGKPLTLTSLGELMKSPKQGNSTQYAYFDLGEYTDEPVPKAHWVLMTRDVIPGSRCESYINQQKLVASYAQKAQVPYQVPNILDATVAIWMHYVLTGVRLYGDNSWTYTRCQEKWNAHWQLVVGGLSAAGLIVSYDGFDDDDYGVSCSRKF